MEPRGVPLSLAAALLLLLLAGAASGGHSGRSTLTATRKCWAPRGVVGTCQTVKACGLTSSFSLLFAVRHRLCYWSGGQPYVCCRRPARDLSFKRRYWYGLNRGGESADTAETSTTVSPMVDAATSISTSTPRPSTTAPTVPHTVRPHHPTVQPTPAGSRHVPFTIRPPSWVTNQPVVAASVPVPSKRLRPPRPPVLAFDVGLFADKEEEVLTESEKRDMPTVAPFPMDHKEEESQSGDTNLEDVQSICGRSDPVAVADPKSVDALREAFPDINPMFAVPGGVFGKEARVAGGVASVQGRWPWMVMLGKVESFNVTWLCGGSIIDEYHVLTAAHCILERPNVVRVGDHSIDIAFGSEDKSKQHEIAKLTLHPKYRPPRSYHDIGIITLRRALRFTRFVRPICLPPPDLRLRRGMTAKITGHGYQEFNSGKLATQLQEAQIQVVRRKFCNASYARLGRAFFDKYPNGVLSHMICAGDKKGGIDACQGDSGGPLLQHDDATDAYHQIGVISSGFGCGNPEYPGLYVSVRHHLQFIEAVTSSHPSRVTSSASELVRPRSARLVASTNRKEALKSLKGAPSVARRT